MTRQEQFLMLVQTAALERALKTGDMAHDSAAPVLARAMRIRPRCLPADLSAATFDVIEWLMCGQKQPGWVR